MEKKDYKVFLPQTNFSMRANLAVKEKEILNFWQDINLYQKLREQSKGKQKFILHYGPPYANGHIHIGHALTYVLKDILNKFYQMSGYDAPMVPGWDCHGLPIEWKVEEEYKTKGIKKEDVDQIEFIRSCRDFAKKWIDIQKEEIQRLGIIADWLNPYCTMDFESEATIAKELGKFLLNGSLYKGLKPVMWSVVEKTALAEAEVEYHDHTSDSIFVKFPIVTASLPQLSDVSCVIWTTTPWTLPANRAIAYGSDFNYVVIEINQGTTLISNGEKLLLAHDLLGNFCKTVGVSEYKILHTLSGEKLEGTICAHPWKGLGYDFPVPLLPGSHVTLEAGTGLVHTAPSHGVEDFILGKEYNLEVPELVQGDGVYAPYVPIFASYHIYKVNQKILEELQKVGALLYAEKITHSYPHSWRSKAPLIYRAASQWFISMEKNNLRKKALEAIEQVEWTPPQGKNRIKSMIENRPDWCLSRQRTWGMPITVFVNKEDGQPLKDAKVHQRIVDVIAKEGLEAWHKYDTAYFLQNDYKAELYEKVYDILDVWFESGCSHVFTLEERSELKSPADIYFEGSDQHRGWFQSSLLNSCATRDQAPYRKVITHGFVLDEKGYKMSKSQGNVVAPQQIIDKMGADMVRLWVTLSDYQNDVRLGQNILKRHEDVYRRLRNTLRYLLGALDGFTMDKVVDYSKLPDLEKYILHCLKKLEQQREKILENYDFSAFYNELHNFCAIDLSAFYFDTRKDCLYCDDQKSLTRQATQTVMFFIFNNLTLWLAPTLSFTAEEAWQSFYGDNSSIHLQNFEKLPDAWTNNALEQRFIFLRNIRKVITGGIELKRASKVIGSSLEADVTIYVNAETANKIKDIDWAELTIVSKATIIIKSPPANSFKLDELEDIGVVVKLADGEKCARCWQIKIKSDENKDLCHRCNNVVKNYE